MKRLCMVTIIFCLIISFFIVPSFADSSNGLEPYKLELTSSNEKIFVGQITTSQPVATFNYYYTLTNNETDIYVAGVRTSSGLAGFLYAWEDINFPNDFLLYRDNVGYTASARSETRYDDVNLLYFFDFTYGVNSQTSNIISEITGIYSTGSEALDAIHDIIVSGSQPSYTKNPNVDEFIANTLISIGIRYSQYSDALNIASAAWDYIIDENNWYISSGDRNDKDIVWNIDTAVSYANAQSNNYLDWYNGYKVNKDLTVALTKFISDNYIASGLQQGTLAGYSVYYNSSYSYSAGGYGFGGSPSAYSFYPASTITYFNGAYLHADNVIDQDEFVYSPADVRKFLGYPSSSGLIEPPDSSSGSGVITDGNGDTVYNIDLDWPSFDWLAAAIQSVLDFLDRLLTTIADFLTQILDAILSLFSDAFESLTEFGEGIIEWLYAIVAGFSTIGGNYIPASLWAVILPFILINIGVGLIMFVMRSH